MIQFSLSRTADSGSSANPSSPVQSFLKVGVLKSGGNSDFRDLLAAAVAAADAEAQHSFSFW